MAWDKKKQQELDAINAELSGELSGPARSAEVREQLKNVSPWRAATEMVFGQERRFGIGSAAEENRTAGERAYEAVPDVTSSVGADVGGRVGGAVGGAIPGPFQPVTRKGGEYVGRLTGAWATGYATKAVEEAARTWDSEESLDDWFSQIHEHAKAEGQEQATGEALSIPIGAALHTGKRVLQRLADPKIDTSTSAIAAWMHGNFKRSYDLAKQKVKDSIIRDPAMAERVIANQGLTRAEKLNNRVYDLMNGLASGSYWGGGRMRKHSEARDDLFRLTARQFGEDVGKQIDPSDVANLIHQHVYHEMSVEGPLKRPLLNTLETKAAGATVGTRKMNWMDGGREFDFMHKFEDVDQISVRQYRQLRDGNAKLVSDFRQTPEIREQAKRNIQRLDARASRSLPPDGVTALKDVLAWEKNYNKKYGDKFIEGILSDKNNARSFVDGLMNKPDYRKLMKVMGIITDDEVKGNIRRALLDRTLDRAMLPSGDMKGDAFRKTVDMTVGTKPLRKVLGPEMAKNVDKFVKAREYLQSISKRGDAARMSIAMGQGSLLFTLPAFVLNGNFTPAAGSAISMLTIPRVAAQFLTSPGAARYAKFIQTLSGKRVPQGKVMRMARDTLGFVVDHKVAERIAGRWFTGEPLGSEDVAALNEAAKGEQDRTPSKPPPKVSVSSTPTSTPTPGAAPPMELRQ